MALLTNKHRRSSAAESDDKTMHWNSRHPLCKNVVVHRAWLSKLSTTADIIYVNMPGSNGDSFDSLGRVVGGWGDWGEHVEGTHTYVSMTHPLRVAGQRGPVRLTGVLVVVVGGRTVGRSVCGWVSGE